MPRSAWRHWKTRWRVTASRTSSTPTRAASLPGRPSPERSPTTALRSAWTAKAPGGTTCSSSGYGEASNTKRCTCEPTTACPRPALRSAVIWTSTTAADRMRALTASHPIKPTSPRCPSAWQPNHGRGSTYRRGKSVQTTGTTSDFRLSDNVENLALQGSAGLQGYGNGSVNAIFGNSGDNLLDGGAGADAMTGGLGNDIYFVDNIADQTIENPGQGNDTVFSTVDFRLSDNVENLVLQGKIVRASGSGRVNAIVGTGCDNSLDGG